MLCAVNPHSDVDYSLGRGERGGEEDGGGHHSLEWKKECIASAPGKGIDRDLRGDRGTDLGYEG